MSQTTRILHRKLRDLCTSLSLSHWSNTVSVTISTTTSTVLSTTTAMTQAINSTLHHLHTTLPYLLLSLTTLTLTSFLAIYVLLSLGRFLFDSISRRIGDDTTAVTAALLLSVPLVAVEVVLWMVLSWGEGMEAWTRRAGLLRRGVVCGAVWCGCAMVLGDVGVWGWGVCVSLVAALVV